MINIFDAEINALNKEILALKTEKDKRLDDLILAELRIPVSLVRDSSNYIVITVWPKNNVVPLITYYLDVGSTDLTNAWIQSGGLYIPDDEPITSNKLELRIDLDSRSALARLDGEIVFLSTSELNYTVRP